MPSFQFTLAVMVAGRQYSDIYSYVMLLFSGSIIPVDIVKTIDKKALFGRLRGAFKVDFCLYQSNCGNLARKRCVQARERLGVAAAGVDYLGSKCF